MPQQSLRDQLLQSLSFSVEDKSGTQAVEMDAVDAGVFVWDILRRFMFRIGPSVLPSPSAAAAGSVGGTVFTVIIAA
jgi:hypothetical protein